MATVVWQNTMGMLSDCSMKIYVDAILSAKVLEWRGYIQGYKIPHYSDVIMNAMTSQITGV